MNSYSVLSLVWILSTLAEGANIPQYISTCKVREASFKDCVIKNGNAAIPKLVKGDKAYNIPPLNPLILPSVSIEGIGGLHLNGTDVKINGLMDAKLIDANVDLERSHIFLKLMVPLLDLDLQYNVAGKIASFPLEGKGHGKIDIVNGNYLYAFDFHIVEDGGKKNFHIGKDKFVVDPEKVTFKLENLFNGDVKLGEQMNRILNENWKDVLAEAGPAITEVVATILKSLVGNILNNIPVNSIFPDF